MKNKLEIVKIGDDFFQAVERSSNDCTGCAFDAEINHCCAYLNREETACVPSKRVDGKEVIWVKVEAPQLTIKNVKEKASKLRADILNLVRVFEKETSTRVDDISLVTIESFGVGIETVNVNVKVSME